MIKYNLKCQNNHEFESWFSDSHEFEKLNKKNLLECIYCESKDIRKSIMAPMVSVFKEKDDEIKKLDRNFKNERESYHRPLTFIIAENRTIKATSDALFQGKTFIWFHDLIIGKEENLYVVASENLSVISEGYNSGGMFSAKKLLKVKLINHSVAPIQLKYLGEFTFHSDFNFIDLAPKSEKEVYIKTKNILTTLDLPFEILNYVIAPKTNLKINKKINIE